MTEAGSDAEMGRLASLIDRSSTRVDVAWLATFRFCFGTVMAISMGRFLAYGWVDNFFVSPRYHFKYWGFEWVQGLPGAGMHAVFWMLLVLAILMAFGVWYRLSSVLFLIGFGYVQLIDATNYLNHYYLAWLLACLLAVSPAAEAWSFDAWRRSTRGVNVERVTPSVSVSWLWVFRLQVGVVYTYAGLAKLHADWLGSAQPLRIWLGPQTEVPLLGQVFTWGGVPLLMSWAGFVFDSTIVLFLLWPRTRVVAYGCVLVFHAMTRSLFPIGMFSTIMVLSALVFFSPSWPRRVLALLAAGLVWPGAGSSSVEPTRGTRTRRGPWWWAWCAVGVTYCSLQVVMPLRFLVYGGNVRWHEQGMRLSWRVMVREKNGSVTFYVRDPRSGRELSVAPRAYLTRLQEREMSGQPDLILQLAHRIRDDYEKRLDGPVEVRAEALVSLNGRRPSPMIDRSVDLAQVHDGLAKYHWVLPAPDTEPPSIRPI